MKIRTIFLAFCLAAGQLALAQEQVKVELSLERDKYLANESLEVRVRVTNRSGQTLHLGKETDWLTFTVSSADNRIISRYSEVPVVGEFVLENGERGTLKVDIAPHFGIEQPSRYRVIATVNFRELGVLATSDAMPFDIQKGANLWSQEFGVPRRTADGGGPPEVRKYALQTASTRFYLRLSDPRGVKVFKVLPLEDAVSYTSPKTQFDRAGNLHLLYQTGARSFYYWIVDPDGNLLVRQTHVYNEGHGPKLVIDGKGSVQVLDGARQLAPTDLPPANKPGAPPASQPPTL